MALSNSYDWTLARDAIITAALRKVGAVPQGLTASSSQITEGAEALNAIVKQLDSEGKYLWSTFFEHKALNAAATEVTGTDGAIYTCIKAHTSSTDDKPVTGKNWQEFWSLYGSTGGTWQAAQAYVAANTVALGVTYHDVVRASIRDLGYEYPLDRVPFSELKTKDPDIFNRPRVFAVEWTPAAGPTVHLYPYPDRTNYLLRYEAVKLGMDFDATDNNIEMKPKWVNPLVYALASQLADDYGLPLQEREYLSVKARSFIEKVKASEHVVDEHEPFVRGAFD